MYFHPKFKSALAALLGCTIALQPIIAQAAIHPMSTVKTDSTTANRDIRMKGNDEVPARLLTGYAHIAHHNTHAATWDEEIQAAFPNLVQLVLKSLISFKMAKLVLAGCAVVLLESPIRRRCNDQMNGLRLSCFRHLPCIAKEYTMFRW